MKIKYNQMVIVLAIVGLLHESVMQKSQKYKKGSCGGNICEKTSRAASLFVKKCAEPDSCKMVTGQFTQIARLGKSIKRFAKM